MLRYVKAAALALVLAFSLVLMGAVAASAKGMLDLPSVVSVDSLEEELSGYAIAVDELPAWVSKEVIDVRELVASGQAKDLRAAQNCSVISWVDAREGAQDLLAGELEERGWSLVTDGVDGVTSGTKRGGECQWTVMTCSSSQEGTMVVLRL